MYEHLTLHGQVEGLRDLADQTAKVLDALADRADACGELELRDDLRLSESTVVEDLRAMAERCEEVIEVPE